MKVMNLHRFLQDSVVAYVTATNRKQGLCRHFRAYLPAAMKLPLTLQKQTSTLQHLSHLLLQDVETYILMLITRLFIFMKK